MNLEELAENLGLEKACFLELVELYLETCASDFSKLQSSIDERNLQKVAEVAHSIKGASVNLGFMGAHEAANKIEEKTSSNSLEGVAETVQVLKKELDIIAEIAK